MPLFKVYFALMAYLRFHFIFALFSFSLPVLCFLSIKSKYLAGTWVGVPPLAPDSSLLLMQTLEDSESMLH